MTVSFHFDNYYLMAMFAPTIFIIFYQFEDRGKHVKNIAAGRFQTHISLIFAAGVLTIWTDFFACFSNL